MNRVVVCQVEGIDPPVLTRWRFYEVLGEDSVVTPMIRVRADDGAERWFPASLFAPAGAQPPGLVRWQFDEPVRDVRCDYVEISLDMSDGTRRWCNVVTLKWLERRLSDPLQCPGLYPGYTLILPSLTPELIETTLKDLEASKKLTWATLLLSPPSDAEEDVSQ